MWDYNYLLTDHSHNILKIRVPDYDQNLAEFLGILFGDGSSYRREIGKRIRAYQIRIAGHLVDDKEYLVKFVKPLAKSLFELEGQIHPHYNEDIQGLYLKFNSKLLSYFLEKIGFPPGNKIKNRLIIPFWIKTNTSYLTAFLRGLVDTDGSIYRMSNRDPQLIRLAIKNFIPGFLDDLALCLQKLGFHPCIIRSSSQIFLSRKDDIQRYVKKVGFNNQKHIYRFKILSKNISPVV